MKAVQLPGYGEDEWLIDMEFSPWSPRVHVWRTEGDQGKAITFPSKEAAEAQIAVLLAGGEQAAIFKYDPTRATAPAEELAKRKPGRPQGGK